MFEQSGDRAALLESIKQYRRARNAWAELANAALGIYQADVTVGELPQLRGHWLDRLPAIDADIAALQKKLEQTTTNPADAKSSKRIERCIQECLGKPHRATVAAHHTPPSSFHAGQPLELELALQDAPRSVQLYYRHVNQGERYETAAMQSQGNHFRAAISAAYTNSPYPLQYYFAIKHGSGRASLHPGFAPDLANQPYFVIRQA